jgi:hypothetical protein
MALQYFKIIAPVVAFAFTVLCSPAHAALVYEYKFDDSPGSSSASTGSNTVAVNFQNGAAFSADAAGVSGAAGDYALDLTADSGGQSYADHSGFQIDDTILTSFTIIGWYNTTDAPVGVVIDNHITFFGGRGFQLEFNGTSQLVLTVDDGSITSDAYPDPDDTWQYFSVTYDGALSSDNVQFYTDTGSGPETHGSVLTLDEGTTRIELESFSIGTTGSSIDGLLDNIKLDIDHFGSSGALTESELQDDYDEDVPLPTALHLGVFLLMMVWVKHRARDSAVPQV